MHNFVTVFTFELIRTLKKPSFWISILAVPVVIGIIFALNYFSSTSWQNRAEEQEEQRFSLQVFDESGYISDQQLENLGAMRISDKQAGIAAVKNDRVDAFFYYPQNPAKENIEIYNHDDGLFENFRYPAVAEAILTSSAEERIGSSETLQLVKGEGLSLNQTSYENGAVIHGFEQLVLPGIFLILFFFVIFFLSGQMLTSTTEEKENRVIEMILTTIKPRALIVGKIAAIITLGLVQATVMLLPLLLAFIFFREQITLPSVDLANVLDVNPWRVILAAGYFIGSVLLFTGLLVGISAAVPTAKDANNFLGFAIFGMFIPFYAATSILTDPDQPIVQIFTYFPLTAPTTLLARNAIGNLSTFEAILGLIILLVAGLFAIATAARIFRYGTLQYSRRLTLKELLPSNKRR